MKDEHALLDQIVKAKVGTKEGLAKMESLILDPKFLATKLTDLPLDKLIETLNNFPTELLERIADENMKIAVARAIAKARQNLLASLGGATY
jgi:hypothetical protein